MNNIFSFNRFAKLLKKEFYEYFQRFGSTLLVFLSFIIVAWGISLLLDDGGFDITTRRTGMYILTYVIAILSPFVLYGYANHPKKGIYYALLPASSFEKFLSSVIYTAILTPVLFLFSAVLLDSLLLLIKSPSWSVSLISGLEASSLWQVYLNLIQIVALFLFANMLFKKQKITKSLLSMIGIIIIISIIVSKVVEHVGIDAFFISDITTGNIGEISGNIAIASRGYLTEILQPWFRHFLTVINILIPVGALTGTFFKIKTQKY